MGYAHPDILLDELTSTQLSEWEAYDRLDPIGSWREDFRMAYICSTIVNTAIRSNSKNGKLTSVADFMVDWDVTASPQGKRQSVEEMKRILLDMANRQNKKVAVQSRPKKLPKLRDNG